MEQSNGRVMFDCRTGIFRMTGLLCSFADFRPTERTEISMSKQKTALTQTVRAVCCFPYFLLTIVKQDFISGGLELQLCASDEKTSIRCSDNNFLH